MHDPIVPLIGRVAIGSVADCATGKYGLRMTLLAATGDGFARLDRRGQSWTCHLSLRGTGAQCLARDPEEQRRLYLGCRGSGLLLSRDGGDTWEDAGLPEEEVFSVAVNPADGAVYAGCEPSALYRSDDHGASWSELESLKRIPSAPTWSFPPRPWTSHVRWIAPSPHESGLLLVGIELGGLMRSKDGGSTWSDHRPGAQKDVHAIAWHPQAQGRAYEAGGGGAAFSLDAGATWQPADEGRDRHYTWALAVDPNDPDCWYVSASPGPIQAHRGPAEAFLYRRRGGAPWERLDGGLPQPLDSMPYALTIADGSVYAGLSDGSLYESRDAGDSWELLAVEGEPPPSVVALM